VSVIVQPGDIVFIPLDGENQHGGLARISAELSSRMPGVDVTCITGLREAIIYRPERAGEATS